MKGMPFYSDYLLDSEDDYHSVTVVETSVTNNSLSEDYSHLDDHTRKTMTFYVSLNAEHFKIFVF